MNAWYEEDERVFAHARDPYKRVDILPSIRKETVFTPLSTTLLVSPWTEGLDLRGLNEPEDEILEQPEQQLPMDVRQRTTRD